MKQAPAVLLSFVLLVCTGGCRTFEADDGVFQDLEIPLDETFQLHVGESATIATTNDAVAFIRKTFDTRCPSDADCSAHGSVALEMSLTTDDGHQIPFSIRGYVGPAGGGEAVGTVLHYHITLERLDPYPVIGQAMSDPAVATLSVSSQ